MQEIIAARTTLDSNTDFRKNLNDFKPDNYQDLDFGVFHDIRDSDRQDQRKQLEDKVLDHRVFKFNVTEEENIDAEQGQNCFIDKTQLYSLNDILEMPKEILEGSVFYICHGGTLATEKSVLTENEKVRYF